MNLQPMCLEPEAPAASQAPTSERRPTVQSHHVRDACKAPGQILLRKEARSLRWARRPPCGRRPSPGNSKRCYGTGRVEHRGGQRGAALRHCSPAPSNRPHGWQATLGPHVQFRLTHCGPVRNPCACIAARLCPRLMPGGARHAGVVGDAACESPAAVPYPLAAPAGCSPSAKMVQRLQPGLRAGCACRAVGAGPAGTCGRLLRRLLYPSGCRSRRLQAARPAPPCRSARMHCLHTMAPNTQRSKCSHITRSRGGGHSVWSVWRRPAGGQQWDCPRQPRSRFLAARRGQGVPPRWGGRADSGRRETPPGVPGVTEQAKDIGVQLREGTPSGGPALCCRLRPERGGFAPIVAEPLS